MGALFHPVMAFVLFMAFMLCGITGRTMILVFVGVLFRHF
jgi:hypothetical protein